MYEQFLEDESSVDEQWRTFFRSYQGNGAGPVSSREADRPVDGPEGEQRAAERPDGPRQPVREAAATGTKQEPAPKPTTQAAAPGRTEAKQTGVKQTGAKQPEVKQPDTKKAGTTTAPTPSPKPRTTSAEPQVSGGAPTPRDAPAPRSTGPQNEATVTRLRGATARVGSNMEASLEIPTATSVRSLPAKLLIDNRIVINNHLARSRGGKVSFTHLIGYAMVKAVKQVPEMNYSYGVDDDGKPVLVQPAHVNLGLAIDVKRGDTRQLLVPSIKSAEEMDFTAFWAAYEDLVRKARDNKLDIADFQGTTISLTNPGGIGTVHSVPRLMKGQGCIIGVGSLEYPAEWQGASPELIARNAVSKILTLTSTYDHRIIQGAQSGEFLKIIHQLLLGEHGFYDEVFTSLRIPYEPVRWASDVSASHEDDVSKATRVQELIRSYR